MIRTQPDIFALLGRRGGLSGVPFFPLTLAFSTELSTIETSPTLLSFMSQSPEPSVTPNLTEPKFGFNQYAERLNGRAAMIGFIAAIAIEYLSGQGLLAWLGLI